MRVGINGFGRIGKAITRINMEKKLFDLVMINDINPDARNLAYQLKYDSTYGTLPNDIKGNDRHIKIDDDNIFVYHKKDISAVPWLLGKVDLVIDCSGVHENVLNAHKIKGRFIKHVIVTHSPNKELVDKHIIMGVNEKTINKNDFLISSSICDANAVAPTLKALDRFGINHGFVTTLHPYLNYQNLLDGQSVSFGYPGTTYGRYELGRASINNLIPKPTSCISAMEKVLPEYKNKFLSMSYRVPTNVVSSADLSIKLDKNPSRRDILQAIRNRIRYQKWDILKVNEEPLTSVDFVKDSYSAVIDKRWIMTNSDGYTKIVLWYDNEWGYSSRVVDLVSYLEELNSEKIR